MRCIFWEGGHDMRVLVAYDGSLKSKEALKFGLSRMRGGSGLLTILYVFDRSLFVYYPAGIKEIDRARGEAEDMLCEAREFAESLLEGVWIKAVMEEGAPEEEIMRHAEECCYDMVVCPKAYAKVADELPSRCFSADENEEGEDTDLPEGYAAGRG